MVLMQLPKEEDLFLVRLSFISTSTTLIRVPRATARESLVDSEVQTFASPQDLNGL